MNTLLSSSRMSFLVNRHAKGQRIGSPPCGGAGRQRRDRETPLYHRATSGKARRGREQRSRCLPGDDVGRLFCFHNVVHS